MKRIVISFILLFLLIGTACAGDLNLSTGTTVTEKTIVNLTAGESTFYDRNSGMLVVSSTLIEGTKFVPLVTKYDNKSVIWTSGEIINQKEAPVFEASYKYDGSSLKETIVLKEDKLIAFNLVFGANTKMIPWDNGQFKIVSSTSGDTMNGIILTKPFGIDANKNYVDMWYTWDTKESSLVLNYNKEVDLPTGKMVLDKPSGIMVPELAKSPIVYPLTIDPTWVSAGGCWTTTNGSYAIVKWNSTGTTTWTPPSGVTNVEVLVVAGGGGAGSGGGGAGGLVYQASHPVSGSITIAVGAGGTRILSTSGSGGNGTNSTFDNITSIGGGGGGIQSGASTGMNGGSGGGAGATGTGLYQGGTKTQGDSGGGTGFGSNGGSNGDMHAAAYPSGGGGGAGGAGGVPPSGSVGGAGGAGKTYNITGEDICYAGGGAGGVAYVGYTAGTATCGGGNGGVGNGAAASFGVNGTGGGGGGITSGTGGLGGSGVVIIKYLSLVNITSSFTTDATTGVYSKRISFTDTSLNTPTAWNWAFTNVTGNNTQVWFNQTQNPVYTFGIGNWSIQLNASNATYSNLSTQVTFINISTPSQNIWYNIDTCHWTQYNGTDIIEMWNATLNTTLCNWTTPAEISNPEYLLIGGGGSGRGNGGGANSGAGGNAGGYSNGTTSVTGLTFYNITIGTGGVGISVGWGNGTNSSFNGINVSGGTGGIFASSVTPPNGGNGTLSNGTQGVGSTGGTGGPGISNNITGCSTYYGGGGGGGFTTGGQGGRGGGGLGGTYNNVPAATSGVNGTGSGGGGISNSATIPGMNGGSGILIVRYSTLSNVVATFTINNTLGTEPLPILFTSTSTGSPTVYNWSFGDNTWNNGTNNTITYTYGSGGNYTVFLIASKTGVASSQAGNQYVTVYNQTTASFTQNATSFVVPPTRASWFNSTSLNATSYNWSFHDGTWQNGTNPNTSFTYYTGGNYTVNLTTTDRGYGSSIKYGFMLVYNQTLSGFTANVTSGIAPLAVGFNTSYVNDNATVWNWSFGDNSYLNGTDKATYQNVTHVYTTGGNFTVTQSTTNSASGSQTQKIQYINVSLFNQTVTGFTANVTSGIAPKSIGFNVTTVNDNATVWNWSFGDGTWQNGTTQNATHAYNNGGIFTIKEIASNPSYTNTTTMTNYITLYNQTRSGFTANVTSGAFPFHVGFNVSLVNDNATGWNWSFGDGTWSNGTTQNITHIYSTGGVYSVSEISWNAGSNNTTTRANYITVYNITIANFTTNNTYIVVPPSKTVWYNSTSINATSYNWSFHDGTWQNGTNPNTSFTYGTGGNYTINLTTTDTGFSSSIKRSFINVYNQTISGFTANVTNSYYPLSVGFNVSSVNDNATMWNWSFGDGIWTNGTTQNVTHTYTTNGVYTVIEITSNPYSSNTTTRTNYITVVVPPKPIVNFTSNLTLGYEGYPIQFTSDSVTNILTYNWSFGNVTANPSEYSFNESQNPVWYCEESGLWSVSLNVTNLTGFNSTTKYNYINCQQLIDNQFEFSFTPPTLTVANGTTYLLTSNIAKLSPRDASMIEVKITWDNRTFNISNIRANTSYFSGNNVSFVPHGGEDFKYDPTNGTAYFTVNRSPFGNFSAIGSTQRPIVDYDLKYVNYTPPGTKIINHTYGEYYDAELPEHTPWYVDNYYNATISFTDWTISANFTSNVTSGFKPLVVQFNDTSSGYPNRWNWSWGDNTYTNATTQNASHTYTSVGTYTVILKSYLWQNNSISNTSTKVNYITVSEPSPVSNFTMNTSSGLFVLVVGMNDTSSNTPTAWNWSFGDGTFASTQNTSHVYGSGGNYTVVLNATNSNTTIFYPSTKYVTVFNHTLSGFTANVTSGIAPTAIKFTRALANDNATWWNWSFGDGAWDNTTSDPVHIYSTLGVFTVSETSHNANDQNTTTRTNYITITELAVVSNLTANITTGTRPLAVQFYDNSTGSPTAWNWSFGDGTYSIIQHPIKVYTISGIYNVTLNATNTNLTYNPMTRINYINVTDIPPVANFTGTPLTGDHPLLVTFTDTSTGDIGTYFNWSFGDGNYSSIQNPTHTYIFDGLYTVNLTVQNTGGINTTSKLNYINATNAKSVVNFTSNVTFGYIPFVVQFYDNSTESPVFWNWSFGDGNYSELQNPVYIYTMVGLYDVKLTVYNAGGSNDTTKLEYINSTALVYAPISSFTMNVTTGPAPLAVGMNDTSTFVPIAWNWSFGDGTYASTQNTSHLFSNEGVYTIKLNVSNAFGSNVSQQLLYVINISTGTGGGSSGTSSGAMWIDPNTVLSFTIITIPAVMIMVFLLFSNRRREE